MSSSRPTTAVVAAVVGVLSPHLGDLMSKNAVEGQRERLGLSPDRLSPDEVELLLQHVSLALELFIGTERAAGVVTAARGRIAGVPLE
jgi:hypothetical protein